MNISIAKKRMSRVLAVDSINSSQADFLATHVPFRKVTLSSNVNGNSVKEYLSESDVYSKLFNQEKSDEHRFVIVEAPTVPVNLILSVGSMLSLTVKTMLRKLFC